MNVSTRLVGASTLPTLSPRLGIGLGLGLDVERILEALSEFRGVPGRMETVNAGQDSPSWSITLIPPILSPTLFDGPRNHRWKIIAVLGCGGDRDKTKRPLMGREAKSARLIRCYHLRQSTQ